MTAPHIKVQLLTRPIRFDSGAAFYAGLVASLRSKSTGTYWQNPGDSGQPPSVRWTLPAGFSAEAMQWPIPERLAAGPLMNYGYSNAVLFPIPMHASNTWPAGSKATLQADIRWLVCAEICIPGHATLSTEITQGPTHVGHDAGQRFNAARAALPAPLPSPWSITVASDGDAFTLEGTAPTPVRGALFFPLQPQQIDNAGAQTFTTTPHGFTLTLPRSEQLTQDITHLAGIVRVDPAAGQPAQAFLINPAVEARPGMPLGWALLLALAGGMILNLMPCVFPVLSIKFISFLDMAGSERARMRQHAWLYALGVLVSFWLLTGALLGLRAIGQQIGWGFQLQSPHFIVVLATLLFAMGLNLVGVFEIGAGLMGVGQSLASRSGAAGAFFTGVLATVVATPCTAPLMGSAVGFALSQSAGVCLLVFTALGSGLALPYVALYHAPGIATWLPRPGPWMVTLRQLMAFPLFATVIWLVWVFALQTDPHAVALLLGDLLLLSIGAWLMGRWPAHRPQFIAALLLIAAGLTMSLWDVNARPPAPSAASRTTDDLPWEPFSPERLAALRAAGRPVFIDFTAAWCVSCQVNETLVFGSTAVREKIRELGMALVKADWTSQDPVITKPWHPSAAAVFPCMSYTERVERPRQSNCQK